MVSPRGSIKGLSNNHELLFPSANDTSLEQCFYRRTADHRGSSWKYHNHILQGHYLRYMTFPIKNKTHSASFRLVLVGGKVKGRMRGIRLHKKSEISTLTMPSAPPNNRYVIMISGYNAKNVEETWQLATHSEDTQRLWIETLLSIRQNIDTDETNKEIERLRNFAISMTNQIPVRSHVGKFRIYRKCFLGSRSIRWIKGELKITTNEAMVIGNRMLNLGILHHVKYEHMLSERRHYYRFTDTDDIEEDEGEENEAWQEPLNACVQDFQNMQVVISNLQQAVINVNRRLNRLQSDSTQELNQVRDSMFLSVISLYLCFDKTHGYLSNYSSIFLTISLAAYVGYRFLFIKAKTNRSTSPDDVDIVESLITEDEDNVYDSDRDVEEYDDDEGLYDNEHEQMQRVVTH